MSLRRFLAEKEEKRRRRKKSKKIKSCVWASDTYMYTHCIMYLQPSRSLYIVRSNVIMRFRTIHLYMSVMRLAMRMSYEDIPLVELMYLVFSSGGVDVPCIYL